MVVEWGTASRYEEVQVFLTSLQSMLDTGILPPRHPVPTAEAPTVSPNHD